jgi:hypothetical protein
MLLLKGSRAAVIDRAEFIRTSIRRTFGAQARAYAEAAAPRGAHRAADREGHAAAGRAGLL